MSKYNESEVKEKLKKFSGWSFNDDQIEKKFEFKDFKEALNFVNKIGASAEEMNHHPDIFLHSWNKVKITVSTHDKGGVTDKDFKLAEKIESFNVK
ncbi:MAG: 4a-hydroxytetrahydrobiopterin dehydratase [Ignavibacteriaceae bacterium]